MKISSLLYKVGINIFRILPAKAFVCKCIKFVGFPISNVYKDLKFSGEFKVNIDNRHNFQLFHHGGKIENETFWKGLFTTFEKDTGWLWKELTPVSNVIFDIGANTGIYSLVAKSLNPTAIIHAFEPSKNTFYKLQKNSEINDFNIICKQIALSNENGSCVFYDSFDANQTSASLSPEMKKLWANFEANEYEVQTQTLKSYILENEVSSIDLMKIDVEMHEPSVIEGFSELLFKYKPNIFIEVLSDEVAKKLNSFFKEDFMIFHLPEENEIVQVKEFKVVQLKWNYFVSHRDNFDQIKVQLGNRLKSTL